MYVNTYVKFDVMSGLVGTNIRRRWGGKSSERQKQNCAGKEGDTDQLFWSSSQSSRSRAEVEFHNRKRNVQHCGKNSPWIKYDKSQMSLSIPTDQKHWVTDTNSRWTRDVSLCGVPAVCGHRPGMKLSDTAHVRHISEHLTLDLLYLLNFMRRSSSRSVLKLFSGRRSSTSVAVTQRES